jgi:DNA/RNA endonuclease YhcR with UshA esterase domain
MVPLLLARAMCGEVSDAKSAAGKLGETVLVEDTVREIVIKDSGTVFLNFGAAYPDEVLAAIVMKDTRPRFPGVETWNGKIVRIGGVVSEHEGHHRIILRERGQITLVAEPK